VGIDVEPTFEVWLRKTNPRPLFLGRGLASDPFFNRCNFFKLIAPRDLSPNWRCFLLFPFSPTAAYIVFFFSEEMRRWRLFPPPPAHVCVPFFFTPRGPPPFISCRLPPLFFYPLRQSRRICVIAEKVGASTPFGVFFFPMIEPRPPSFSPFRVLLLLSALVRLADALWRSKGREGLFSCLISEGREDAHRLLPRQSPPPSLFPCALRGQ